MTNDERRMTNDEHGVIKRVASDNLTAGERKSQNGRNEAMGDAAT
jgi:hypothetical protein